MNSDPSKITKRWPCKSFANASALIPQLRTLLERSPEEVRKRYEEAMGVELGNAFYAIVGQVHYLRAKWGDYVALFGENNRIDLLNKVAPAYFARLQDMSVDDIFLHISRLTDKARTCALRTSYRLGRILL